MENKTLNQIFTDILNNVLQLSENPSQFAEYLTQQIRELIGARTVVIAIKTEQENAKIMSVFPVRRKGWANGEDALQLCLHSFKFQHIEHLKKETSNETIASLLKSLEIDEVIAIPLVAADRIVGSILLLDMLDTFGIESVIELLDKLSGVFALIIRNANLYQNMENLVELRTFELQKRNEDLQIREQLLVSANKEIEAQNLEYKRINKELKEAKEHAEESDRLKSAFLANMSHEIRTPMNGILGFAELLKEPNLTGEQQKHYINIIQKGGARMLNIINDIVDISKIESGLMKLTLSETNINEQIRFVYDFFKNEAAFKGLYMSMETVLPTNEAFLETDSVKLYAILANLVKNALKYTNNGFIEIGYSTSFLNNLNKQVIENDKPFLIFYVKDTGIGIQIERHKAIFDRFVQADIEDTLALQGAGLGLSITKAYVEMLGGRIWVESEPGKGSIFYFTLPYSNKHLEKKETLDESLIPIEKEKMKKLKILIVEDEEISSQLLAIVLGKFDHEIIEVNTGKLAVETLLHHPDIDLVLMDIKMPGLNGYETTRLIREFNSKVVIIAQTAYALSGDDKKALNAGCNDYISKPINKSKLEELVNKYFL